ncbi:uncharacterized protein SCDLUD_001798 [Saccharomycodes ludwigii]|uniref:uncharacterized protein n=1 Tax=Saccharomycodes ludwigii TaxID=36035 RepID=UPI001E8BCB1B|nr:hypothetical protein SCDLUD_001798 [Saccharomycodes ludwigii]KAH3902010.1 hypothetical protein SCDLUD_001798 [Saccharomycodes ludwigii]
MNSYSQSENSSSLNFNLGKTHASDIKEEDFIDHVIMLQKDIDSTFARYKAINKEIRKEIKEFIDLRK